MSIEQVEVPAEGLDDDGPGAICRAAAYRRGRVRNGHILIAEDDLVLQRLYQDYLLRNLSDHLRVGVFRTDCPEEARRWLQEEEGLVLLDGSVFRRMGIGLGELPGRVILCSADEDLVEEARRVGLRAFCKGTGDLSALKVLLQEVQKAP